MLVSKQKYYFNAKVAKVNKVCFTCNRMVVLHSKYIEYNLCCLTSLYLNKSHKGLNKCRTW